jgi:hypothetical protein|nr:MAG TPA: hypothetical protein [Caudoviricetes sp.]
MKTEMVSYCFRVMCERKKYKDYYEREEESNIGEDHW